MKSEKLRKLGVTQAAIVDFLRPKSDGATFNEIRTSVNFRAASFNSSQLRQLLIRMREAKIIYAEGINFCLSEAYKVDRPAETKKAKRTKERKLGKTQSRIVEYLFKVENGATVRQFQNDSVLSAFPEWSLKATLDVMLSKEIVAEQNGVYTLLPNYL